MTMLKGAAIVTMLRALTNMACLLALPALVGCGDAPATTSPPFAHRNAVFHAAAGGTTATSVVEGCYAMDEDGRPSEYTGAMALGPEGPRVNYQFVGQAFCPITEDGEWGHTDVYVVAITTDDGGATETIPVVYRGQRTVVVDRLDLQLTLGPPQQLALSRMEKQFVARTVTREEGAH